MEDARSLLILLRSGLPSGALRELLDGCGNASAVLAAGARPTGARALAEPIAHALARPDGRLLEADMEWLAQPGHHLVGWHSPDYPPLLRSAVHPPAALFIAGDPMLLWHPQVAVVGSRQPSAGGRENARQFARAFGRAGFAVTSGLAQGIDTAAHLGAMDTARTVAVLGTGPDVCYPPANATLFERIRESGAIVTEHPPGTPGIRQHFPSRNRLVAGLSLATVVVEAALRSGALITARMATDAGREVFALPGSIHNPTARGCHRLIRQGAGLAECPEDVIEALAPMAGTLVEALHARLDPPALLAPPPTQAEAASADERRIWRALGHDPVSLDQLCERTGLTVGPLSAMLLAMELDRKISAEHGRYTRIALASAATGPTVQAKG